MEVIAKDNASGKVIWSQKKEYFEPGLDLDGDRRYGAWQMKDILDFTLPPRRTTTEKYYAVFPEGANKIDLEVKVVYFHKAGTEFVVHHDKRTLEYK
ncbi:MAG: hypothetical protein QMD01_07195 [Thermodesulfovibrionales bacterium]|nr:hypothetical protein [Thermodesulfovibrionales bacterium]